MNCPVRVTPGRATPRPAQPRRILFLGSLLTGALLIGPACAPQVVRSSPPPVPNSPSEMAEDTERLDRLIGAGLLKREELLKDREQARALADQLRTRADKDDPMAQLALKRAELTVQLYETLLALAEQKTEGRALRTEQSAKGYQAMRDYLRKVAELEQNVELLPVAVEGMSSPALAGAVSVQQLPPPGTGRLVGACRAGHFDQVVKEVEGAGPDVLPRLEPEAVTAYALSLGGLGRYEDALKIAARVDGETVASEEQLELRFREALWLAKTGKKADATRRLRQLDQEIQEASKRLADFQAPVATAAEQAAKRSPKFLDSYVDARLAIEDGRFEYARTKSREMLERENAVEAVTAVEGLLRQADAAEERAFNTRIEEAQGLARVGDTEQARAALDRIAQDFRAPKFAQRIEQARKGLPVKSPAGPAGGVGGTSPAGRAQPGAVPAVAAPAGVVPGGAAAGGMASTGPSSSSASGTAAPPTSPSTTGVAPATVPPAAPSGGVSPNGAVTASGSRATITEVPQGPAASSAIVPGSAQATPVPKTDAPAGGGGTPGSSVTASGTAPAARATGTADVPPPEASRSGASSSSAPPTGAPPPGSSAALTSSPRPGAPGSVGAPRITGPSGAAQTPAPAVSANGGQAAPVATPSPGGSSSVPATAAAPASGGQAAPVAAPAPGGSSSVPASAAAPTTGSVAPATAPTASLPATGGATSSATPAEAIDWQKTLALGKSLMTTGSYEEAARTFSKLEGTPGEKEGREQRQKAMDRHVQRVREQVAKEYMRAQQLKSSEDRLTLLGDLYNRLKVTLETWPDAGLRAKTEHNLRVIEGEIQKLDAGYFDHHEAFKGDAPPPATGTRP